MVLEGADGDPTENDQEGEEIDYDHRTVCLELQEELQNLLGKIGARHHSSTWEITPSHFVHRTAMLKGLFAKLNTRLKAIQLCGAFERGAAATHSVALKWKMDRLRLPLLELLTCVRSALDEVVSCIVNNKDKIPEEKINLLGEKLKEVQRKYVQTHKDWRKEKLGRETKDGFDVEGNNATELFLGCISSFCREIVVFTKQQYNKEASSEKSWAQVLFFDKLGAVRSHTAGDWCTLFQMSIKVTTAIMIAALLGVYRYSMDSSAAITVAYVVGGHVGGSFNSTVMRVLGVVFGAVFPIILMQLTSTEIDGVFSILVVWVFLCSYVRVAGGKHYYAGSVASFIVVEVLFMSKSGGPATHSESADFGMLEQCCLGVVIFVLVELLLLPKHAPELLQQSLAGAMKDAKVLQSNLYTECVSQLLQDPKDTTGGNATASPSRKTSEDVENARVTEEAREKIRNASLNNVQEIRNETIEKEFALFSSALAAEQDLYNQALLEPEVNRPVFEAHAYKTIMAEANDIRQALHVLKIMYDDVDEWEHNPDHIEHPEKAEKMRVEVMGDIMPTLESLQQNIQACFDQVITVLETSTNPTSNANLKIGQAVLDKKAQLLAKYKDARTKLQKKGSNTDIELLLLPQDRLKMATLMVSSRVLSDSLTTIYRKLKFNYWNRLVPKLDGFTAEQLREAAAGDSILSPKEWRDLTKRAGKSGTIFRPSGNRYG